MADLFLFDSNVIIDYLRGMNEAAAFLYGTRPNQRAISVMNAMEIARGCKDKGDLLRVLDFLKAYEFKILPISKKIFKKAGDLMSFYKSTINIDYPDAIIAATAIQHSMILVTNDRDFELIECLRLKRPYRKETHNV